MKQAAIIVFAIALLGLAGFYAKNHDSNPPAAAQTTSAPASSSPNITSAPANGYKDGTYTGDSEDTPYGTVQVAVAVSGGKITDVNFLQMPTDQPESQQRTTASEPLLKQETISKQSAKIDFVSGATSTSYGYQQSLQAALNQAAQAA